MPGEGPYGGPGPDSARVLRLLFSAAGIVALVCGYFGLAELLRTRTEFEHGTLDLLYYDLQLFVLGSPPLDEGGPFPALLEVARFAAPAVTVYALVEAGRLLFATELRRIRTRTARGHVVICGATAVAATLARRLRHAGTRVVAVLPADRDPVLEYIGGQLWITGDARDPEVLRAAGVQRAAALYACTETDATNVAIALSAERLRGSDRGLRVSAHIADPDLCLTLQARYLGLVRPSGVDIDFFNIDDLAARTLCATQLVQPALNCSPPRVMLAGTTNFGRALIIEAARSWSTDGRRTGKPLLTVVGPAAATTVDSLLRRYSFLDEACAIRGMDGDLRDLLPEGALDEPPDQVFICDDDEERALKTALAVEQHWPGDAPSILVRLDRLAGLRDADFVGAGLLDEVSRRLQVFGVVSAASDSRLLHENLVERLARAIHGRYAQAFPQRGETPATPAGVAWEELPEVFRDSNRAQARDIGRKYRAVGCVISPHLGAERRQVLSEEDVARLAELEHERWLAERWAAGWRYGDQRDDSRRVHPAVVEWRELSPQMRERNVAAINHLSDILAEEGFQVVPIQPREDRNFDDS